MSEPWELQDSTGDVLTVRPNSAGPGVAIEVNDGDVVIIPPHQWPEVCRAGYEALGLPVPDLPDIPDPALVEALARDLHYAMDGVNGPGGSVREQQARALLALGWRKPGSETTDE